MLTKFLALFSTPPVSLQASREINEQARATLDSVSALFTAAGLNLEAMLTAGPDALQAHLASLDQSEAISALEAQLTEARTAADTLQAQLTTQATDLEQLRAERTAAQAIFTALGVSPASSAADLTAAFRAHVEQSAATLLAQDGRPPVQHLAPAAPAATPGALSDAQHLAAWSALPEGSPERAAYAATHYNALLRAAKAQESAA